MSRAAGERLVVIESHPVQYHAPVYRAVARDHRIPVTVIYGSDFSVAGYRDREFGVSFSWDTDLLSGYEPVFLSRTASGGARCYEDVRPVALGAAIEAARPSAMLTLGYRSRFDRAAVWHSVRSGRPVLFRAEATDHARARGLPARVGRDLWASAIYRRCARLLYIGQRASEHYQRLGVADDRLVFSPYCVEVAPFQTSEDDRARVRQPLREALGVQQDDVALVFVGKLSERKGVDLLAAAAQRAAERTKRVFHLLFVGDGDMRSRLEADAANHPSVRLQVVGFKNQSALSPYYHASDLLVLPSRHSETWGLVVNEALHHGVPAVVSDAVGCAPDLVLPGKTGEVAAAGLVTTLADALVRAVALTGSPDVRVRCRQQVSRYSVEQAASGIAAAFHAVVH